MNAETHIVRLVRTVGALCFAPLLVSLCFSCGANTSLLEGDIVNIADLREDRYPVFSALKHNEVLEIQYGTRGCFHSYEYRIELSGGASPTACVYGQDASGLFERLHGSVPLTPASVAQIDAAIRYYRKPPDGWCTTTESFAMTWKTAEQTVIEERTDASCKAGELDPPVMNFYALAQQAR